MNEDLDQIISDLDEHLRVGMITEKEHHRKCVDAKAEAVCGSDLAPLIKDLEDETARLKTKAGRP